MAIRIIEGKIGSGKTYYAVHHVFKSWYKWSDITDEWVVKEKSIDLRIYTNIREMKLGHDLDIAIEKAGGLNKFFNPEYQESFCENANVIYIIDEAQSGEYFPRGFKDKKVLKFFQTCRHFGCDVYFITQDVKCLALELRALAEYHIVAVPRIKSIGNCFTYKFYSGRDCFKTKRIKKDIKVFNMYRSMTIAEGEKIKSALVKYIIMVVVIIGLTGVMFKFVFLNMLLGMGKVDKKEVVEKVIVEDKPLLKKEVEVVKVIGNNFDIVGKVNGFYIVKTYKGLKRVKIGKDNIKNIGDQIKIEKL